MSLLIETIKLNNGIPDNLVYHNLRFNRTRKELFGLEDTFDLRPEIVVPHAYREGLFKCRVIYAESIKEIQFEPYNLRKIQTLKIVYDDLISYTHKYYDRDHLNRLFSLREQADDIIIIKNEYVTDSFICNLVFENRDGLFTPSAPLLKGTRREKLIFEKKVLEKEIRINDIGKYNKVHLINAFIDPGDLVIDISNILY